MPPQEKTLYLYLVVPEIPASRELAQLFGNAVQTAGQAAGQVAEQVTNTVAPYTDDFNKFPDMSKQVQRNFSLAEVQRCAGQDGGCLYVLYDNMVLDLTQFAPHHLGGTSVLLKYGGQDASAAMRASGMPPQVYDVFLRRFLVGTLVTSNESSAASQSSSTAGEPTQSPAVIKTCGWIPSLQGLCKN